MKKQPEALRLAKLLDNEQVRTVEVDVMHCQAAAELLRQHKEIELLRQQLARQEEKPIEDWEANAIDKAIEALRLQEPRAVRPQAYMLIVDPGVFAGVFRFKCDAESEAIDLARRFSIVPLYLGHAENLQEKNK